MLIERSDQRGFWKADRLCLDHVGKDTFYDLPASLRGRLVSRPPTAPIPTAPTMAGTACRPACWPRRSRSGPTPRSVTPPVTQSPSWRAAFRRFSPAGSMRPRCRRLRRPTRSRPAPRAGSPGCLRQRRWPPTRRRIRTVSRSSFAGPRFWHGGVMLRRAELWLCSYSSLSGRVCHHSSAPVVRFAAAIDTPVSCDVQTFPA